MTGKLINWILVGEVIVVAVGASVLIGKQMTSDPQPATSPSDGTGRPKPSGPGRRRGAFGAVDPKGMPLPALRRPRVVVEKTAHRLTVYEGGRAVKSYRAAIGGGKGDKVREGDRCTPVGEFAVCVKNPTSKYVLSLGLTYPNEEDAARGLTDGLIDRAQHDAIVTAIRRGVQPPWNTLLGGEIMIHGDGSGRDWTLGCIALDDDDIRELYPAIPVGTVVEIRP